MRLTRIEIEGFGTLSGMELRFGPTMNLVVGPNEAGKSTLQEAIVTGLYGLQSGDRAHSALVERADSDLRRFRGLERWGDSTQKRQGSSLQSLA